MSSFLKDGFVNVRFWLNNSFVVPFSLFRTLSIPSSCLGPVIADAEHTVVLTGITWDRACASFLLFCFCCFQRFSLFSCQCFTIMGTVNPLPFIVQRLLNFWKAILCFTTFEKCLVLCFKYLSEFFLLSHSLLFYRA